MKRIISLFFLLTFLLANTGMAVSVHYCKGKFSSISIVSLDNHPCKCGKKAMKKDCCKDKTVFLKMKDNLVKSSLLSFKVPAAKHLTSPIKPFEILPLVQTQFLVLPSYQLPPFKPKAPIYLLDRVFLI